MNISRCLCHIRNRGSRNIFRKISVTAKTYESSSAHPAVKDDKFDFENLNVIDRVERRKPAIQPFMKDVMVSVFNRELLAYPEILNKEETQALEERVKKLESILRNPENTEKDKKMALQQCRLYGALFNISDGGLALNVTERIRYLETLSADLNLSKTLSDHWVSIGALKVGLPQDRIDKLSSDLMSGDKTVALCIKEKISTRAAQVDFRTTAQLDVNDVWRVNGEKLCSHSSDYLLTLCAVEASRYRAFLVHPGAEGVSYNKPYVTFRETPAIPLDEASENALSSALALSRLDTAVLCNSMLKAMIVQVVEYVRGKYVNGKPLADVPLIRAKIGEALMTHYAADSMTHFTAGLLDDYVDPEADVEVAMCRTFSSEHGLRAVMSLLTIPGLEGTNPEWTHHLDEFRALTINNEVDDSINVFIAMNGVHHAGKTMASEVKQMRNPLFHPSFIIKKIISNRHQESDDPKLTLYLAEHLHPSLQQSAQALEYCVLRLRYACETLLSRHGADVGIALTELERLARAATEVFAMIAVISRASRSYCIGVRNAEVEMKLAATFIDSRKNVVKQLIRDLDMGEFINLDHFKVDFGKKVLDSGGLVVERATERVWW